MKHVPNSYHCKKQTVHTNHESLCLLHDIYFFYRTRLDTCSGVHRPRPAKSDDWLDFPRYTRMRPNDRRRACGRLVGSLVNHQHGRRRTVKCYTRSHSGLLRGIGAYSYGTTRLSYSTLCLHLVRVEYHICTPSTITRISL